MATFTGTTGSDIADATDGALTGFTRGTVGELQDATGGPFNPGNGADCIIRRASDFKLHEGAGADQAQRFA